MTTFKELSNSMADSVSAIAPSLVRVEGRRRMPATGIVYGADVIVTAHHVVEFEENIAIGLHDGTVVHAKLIGRDPQNDLAVLKVDGGNMTPATWGDNTHLRVGQLVLAVGRPTEQPQASLGAVSALVAGAKPTPEQKSKRSRRRMGQALADGYIQTDVTMYPGFSGGALINGDGSVHGLITSGFGSGASIAVPVTTIQNTVSMLMTHGKMKQGYLGVGVQPVRLPAKLAEQFEQETALLVISLEGDSPAEKAGLMVGDILVGLDGDSTATVDELMMALRGERVGKSVQADIVRGGEHKTVSVMVAERQ